MLDYTINNVSSEGTTLVLLHGFLESSNMWKQVDFHADYPTVFIDLPGHGKSTHPELMCDSIAEMAKMVIDVMDELGIDVYNLIGHSMGGYVGLEVKNNDSRAERMMLLNSNFWSDSPQKMKDRIRVAEIVQTNKSHFIYEVIPNLFINPEEFDIEVKKLISEALVMSSDAIAKASVAMSKRKDFTDFVLKNSKDFTCIQGVEDSIVSAKKMRSHVDNSNVVYIELEGVGHMAHFETTKCLNELIDDFQKLEQKKTET
ncbi:alpha/beta fold hydrolase [bacterium]|nr:alpha/beta fold hydrolase [bacterium]